jgi:phage gp46-like protein
MSEIDLAVRNNGAYYDLYLADDGDLQGTDSFDTAILITLFCEMRAAESEIKDVSRRRGWWGNLLSPITGFEMGSKDWLLQQARKNQATLNAGITYLQTAFGWFITQGYAQNVIVTGNLTTDGMDRQVRIYVGKDAANTQAYSLWTQTGLGNVSVTLV